MLNNKGFAVSAVLYTILIAFLLFLGVTLSNFSAAANVISNANKDLVNGTGFKVMQVKPAGVVTYYDSSNNFQKPTISGNPYAVSCIEKDTRISSDISLGTDNKGNNVYARKYWYETNTIVQIKSRYGTFYWPKDFEGASMQSDGTYIENAGSQSYNKKITVSNPGGLKLEFSVDGYSSTVELTDICAGS